MPIYTDAYRHNRNFIRVGDWVRADPPLKKDQPFLGTVVRIELTHETDDPTIDDVAALHLCVELKVNGTALHERKGQNRILGTEFITRLEQTQADQFAATANANLRGRVA